MLSEGFAEGLRGGTVGGGTSAMPTLQPFIFAGRRRLAAARDGVCQGLVLLQRVLEAGAAAAAKGCYRKGSKSGVGPSPCAAHALMVDAGGGCGW